MHYEIDLNVAPVVRDGVVYAGSSNGNLYALEAASGELPWRYDTDSAINFSPIATGPLVYMRVTDGYVYAIRTEG